MDEEEFAEDKHEAGFHKNSLESTCVQGYNENILGPLPYLQ